MNNTDKQMVCRLRAALMKRPDCRINSRTGLARCKAEVERITGKPLSETPAMLAQQINTFCSRNLSDGMPVRPFVPLVGYTKALMKRRELCEMTR